MSGEKTLVSFPQMDEVELPEEQPFDLHQFEDEGGPVKEELDE